MGFFDRFRRGAVARSADDWSAFAGREHMFFGLTEPFALMRREVEAGLTQQVSDTVVVAIRTQGVPHHLTLGKKTADPTKIIVSFVGFAVQAEIEATSEGQTHRLPSTLTFVFGRVDERGHETARSWIDLGADAAAAFDEDHFRERFLAFRAEHP